MGMTTAIVSRKTLVTHCTVDIGRARFSLRVFSATASTVSLRNIVKAASTRMPIVSPARGGRPALGEDTSAVVVAGCVSGAAKWSPSWARRVRAGRRGGLDVGATAQGVGERGELFTGCPHERRPRRFRGGAHRRPYPSTLAHVSLRSPRRAHSA